MNLSLQDPEFYLGDVDAAYRWLRIQAPVYWCETGRFWALSKHADILSTSRRPELFCSGRGVLIRDGLRDALRGGDLGGVPPSIIHMDPPAHGRYRKLVIKAFTPRMVSSLEPRIREIARASLESVPIGETVDFVEHVSVPLPMLVIAEMLGVAGGDRAEFRRWSDAIIAGAETGPTPATMEPTGELFAYFHAKLEERRREPEADLVSALATAEIDGERLADEEILMFCLTLLVAGNETTRNLISGGARALVEFPEQKRRLLDDPVLIPGAVEEMLRWVTPVKAFARTATLDTEVRGQRIAAGDYLVLLYASGNRDEEVWGPTAARFDVTRLPDPSHVAFGFGEHMCIGASLARLESRVMFEELLARLPNFEPAGEIERLRSTVMNGIVRMPVVFR